MMIVRNEVSVKEKKNIISMIKNDLQSESEVRFAYLHGSFLRGKFNDIDIGIYFSSPDSDHIYKKKRLDFELKKEVGLSKKVGFKVDVRCLNDAPNNFCYNVIKDGELLFSDDESLRSDFESLVLVKHHDFQRYRKRYRKKAIGV